MVARWKNSTSGISRRKNREISDTLNLEREERRRFKIQMGGKKKGHHGPKPGGREMETKRERPRKTSGIVLARSREKKRE